MFEFLKKPKYPDQQLSDTQKELIAFIDAECQKVLSRPEDGTQLHVHHFTVPIAKQMLPMHTIRKHILQNLPNLGGYIPRTVAFIQVGLDWHYMVGVYKVEPADKTVQTLFIDALTRTNTARSENA